MQWPPFVYILAMICEHLYLLIYTVPTVLKQHLDHLMAGRHCMSGNSCHHACANALWRIMCSNVHWVQAILGANSAVCSKCVCVCVCVFACVSVRAYVQMYIPESNSIIKATYAAT